MGKPTGFLEYARELPAERAALQRILDYSEFRERFPKATLREQGARCMDCGTPFCHVGSLISGLAVGCPIQNLIPEWNDLVYRGRWQQALERLHKTNNFPEFTGRVCPAPCEGSCVLGINAPPVAVKAIECAIVDRGFENGWIVPEAPQTRTDKTIAIIGSGPAGLTCAAQLNRAGHRVTVFERADRIGGLLMYGIPNMKLDKRIVERRTALLAEEGVRFVTATEVGIDLPAATLLQQFDAVVLCGGATLARDLPIEGRDLIGIHFAMEFLRKNTRSLLDSNFEDRRYISAQARHVVVIGGGDTGTDCVATALRHGCKSLVQLEILPHPPEDRALDNPWPQWPKIHRLDYGHEEAMALAGSDPRRFCVLSKRFRSDGDGHVIGLETIDVEWTNDKQGRPAMIEIPGSQRTWRCDLVLLALGFVGPERSPLLDQLGIALDARGNVAADEHMMTNVKGVFAAGDMRRGQSLVVWAISEGRRAARCVDRFLTRE